MYYLIKARAFLLENRQEEEKNYLEVIDGRFGQLIETPQPEAEVIDFGDSIIAPGLFDTHIHGVNGADVMDGTQTSFQVISEALLGVGVTRFLPTTLTSSVEELTRVVKKLRVAIESGLNGAKPEGIYLEGPYFTPEHKGAQNPKYFTDPSLDDFHALQQASGNHVVKIALASERAQAINFIKAVSKENVKVALGHTNADFDTANEAIHAGATIFVHLFNGMKGLHHRDPGTAGACLLNEQTFAELICDGYHVCADMVNLTHKIKKDHLVLITDCMKAGLLPEGHYNLGEFPVIVKDGVARTEHNGSLAGSVLKLIDGVKNIAQWANIDLFEAWKLGSMSPAISMGVQDRIGSIAEGKCADFVVLDNELNVTHAAVDGKLKDLHHL
ncbi:N-acetylglucosamine-6-phosphate deacetylase [Sporolactobacillus terrae]|uniref:N-acetylglucosamine-6-phosphate deacetylase n=1 Tax=Sporolactobacillus terrae TaxID=269673 RepID=A0ABX5Q4R3_9BACL|nr:N-acetylglucosamine-6-phosphate deacetylase [Sporolactobacillus terrae]QAA21623.1 N-acetylglucosamine-6-phosphate deacetylase [Sporolactobacillus terrae]QAA24595.1 N-acetylglucosamine-6-phosphate deacetylase [Sporolactobacillus terrae]UAK16432.1 N-acetylglucosamine-6-phosphate deacetylase [Sporolactobacillus terrae]